MDVTDLGCGTVPQCHAHAYYIRRAGSTMEQLFWWGHDLHQRDVHQTLRGDCLPWSLTTVRSMLNVLPQTRGLRQSPIYLWHQSCGRVPLPPAYLSNFISPRIARPLRPQLPAGNHRLVLVCVSIWVARLRSLTLQNCVLSWYCVLRFCLRHSWVCISASALIELCQSSAFEGGHPVRNFLFRSSLPQVTRFLCHCLVYCMHLAWVYC
jgi:hypothetical protein